MMQKKPIIGVVEDSAMLRALISNYLKQQVDCDLHLFENADQAYKVWDSLKPDALILDYNYDFSDLQFKNGLDFLQEIRKESKVPVIALSGQMDKEIMASMIKEGANDYIPKEEPDFLEHLGNSVKTVLSFKETQQEIRSSLFSSNTKFLILILGVILGLSILFQFLK